MNPTEHPDAALLGLIEAIPAGPGTWDVTFRSDSLIFLTRVTIFDPQDTTITFHLIAEAAGQLQAIPEPSSIALGGIAVGLTALSICHRRRTRQVRTRQ